MTRLDFLNTQIDSYNFQQTIDEMEKIIATRTTVQHVVLNANKINLMAKNEELRRIVNESPLINADGQSIVWANKILNKAHPVYRVTGIDLFESLIQISDLKGYKVYYLGAKGEVLNELIAKHKQIYENLNIVGYQDGYFDRSQSKNIVKKIKESKADILFVALPSPEKEIWIDKYKIEMDVPLLVGVGGSFDVVSGKISRAPKVIQKLGLEWLYRWSKEPIRLFKRYFIGNISFIIRVFKGYLIGSARRLAKN
jgi:bacterial polymer biosynthesis proteins, WecB/TagA/CpsF family